MTHQNLGDALSYARSGWPVFLLGRTKRPLALCDECQRLRVTGTPHDPQGCRCLTCHGFYAASLDPKQIRRMFALHPSGLLAIRTGAASGVVGIDVDPRAGGAESLARLVEQGLTPPTRFVRTGSGGLHLYYRHPGPHMRVPCSNGKPGQYLGAGIDVRGDGGYLVAPPSVHPATGRPYVWADRSVDLCEMSPALVTACLPPTPAPAPDPAPTGVRSPVSRTGAGDTSITSPTRLMDALLHRIDTAPRGTRRVTLYGCARGVARIVNAGHLTSRDAYDRLIGACDRAGWDHTSHTDNAIRDGFRAEGVAW